MIQQPTLLPHDDHDDEDRAEYDRGLVYDLGTLDRRRMLQILGFGGISASLFVIAGCTPGAGASGSVSAAATAAAVASADAASCVVIPEETAGPFPGDGSNGPDVLNQSGVVRSDIRSSFGSSSDRGRGRAAHHPPRHPGRDGLRPDRGRCGLSLALRPGRELLALLAGGRERELPARRPGGRRRRHRDLHQRLPGVLLGALAAHPFRGLSEPRPRDRREQQDRDVPDRAARRTPATSSTRPPATSRA